MDLSVSEKESGEPAPLGSIRPLSYASNFSVRRIDKHPKSESYLRSQSIIKSS
jgi:hypothetical protein